MRKRLAIYPGIPDEAAQRADGFAGTIIHPRGPIHDTATGGEDIYDASLKKIFIHPGIIAQYVAGRESLHLLLNAVGHVSGGIIFLAGKLENGKSQGHQQKTHNRDFMLLTDSGMRTLRATMADPGNLLPWVMNEAFYALSAQTPAGQPIDFASFKGKVVLLVNTATRCGFTPQLVGLEALHQRYKDSGLMVIGFPCNQFGGQEPEPNDHVEEVCRLNYGVSFPLTAKTAVNGEAAHPVFRYLKKKLGGFLGSRIKWNFTKFLVDREGVPYKRYAPTTTPAALEKDIQRLLG